MKEYFVFKIFQLREQSKTFRFYKHSKFFLIDLLLFLLTIFYNPYRSCRKFFQKKGLNHLGIYGETPLSSWQKLSNVLGLSSSDTVLELGSGRGKGCFWLSEVIGCRAIGIEWNSVFVLAAKVIGKLTGARAEFIYGNMLEVDFPIVNVVYLYGTCLKDPEIKRLLEKIRFLPLQTRIISISYSLSAYEEGVYKLDQVLNLRFPWGETQAFIHRKIA